MFGILCLTGVFTGHRVKDYYTDIFKEWNDFLKRSLWHQWEKESVEWSGSEACP